MLTNQEYIQNTALSQSDIKLFEKNIIEFYNQKILGLVEEVQSDPMDIGSIVDAIMLDPEELKKYYVVTDLKAKGKVKEVVDLIWNKTSTSESYNKDLTLAGLTDYVKEAIKQVEYQLNWKEETRIKKIEDEGQEYYEQLQEARGMYMVSLESWNTAHALVQELTDDNMTASIIEWLKHPETIPDNITLHLQEVLEGEFELTKLKGKLDFFIVDNNNKVIEPWDVKTAKNHNRFKINYKASKYGRQGAFYTELLKQNYPDYKILPFKFLVLPVENNKKLHEDAASEKPEVYAMTAKELQIHTDGVYLGNGYRIKGWKELVKEIQWHINTQNFQHRKEYYETGMNTLDTLAGIDIEVTENTEQILY